MAIKIKWVFVFAIVSSSLFAFACNNLDISILKIVNGSDEPWFDLMKPIISTDYFAGIVGISPIFIDQEQTLLSFGFTLSEVEIFKILFHRPRPFQTYNWVIKRADAQGYSMPSGHSAMAFEAAYIWSEYFPQFSPIFYSIAAYIAVSRIYYGVHYPSDVLVGAIIGYFNAKMVSNLFKPKTMSFSVNYAF